MFKIVNVLYNFTIPKSYFNLPYLILTVMEQ